MVHKKKKKVINYTAENQLADNYLQQVINAATSIFNRGGGTNGISPDGRRDYNVLFGYLADPKFSDFKSMYERSLGFTLCTKLPKSCWRELPKITVNDKEILVDEMLELKKSGFFKSLERADIANRIGSYSVMFIGVPDDMKPDMPIGQANKDNFDGLYYRVYEECGINVAKWNDDPASSRFNMPEIYSLQTSLNESGSMMGKASAVKVHHSRIIHMAEGALSNELVGVSCLKAPWNALVDCAKVTGSNAEANFKNSRQKNCTISKRWL